MKIEEIREKLEQHCQDHYDIMDLTLTNEGWTAQLEVWKDKKNHYYVSHNKAYFSVLRDELSNEPDCFIFRRTSNPMDEIIIESPKLKIKINLKNLRIIMYFFEKPYSESKKITLLKACEKWVQSRPELRLRYLYDGIKSSEFRFADF